MSENTDQLVYELWKAIFGNGQPGLKDDMAAMKADMKNSKRTQSTIRNWVIANLVALLGAVFAILIN